jgi:hypothetical protein
VGEDGAVCCEDTRGIRSLGDLTGVNPASHPSSYVTAKSMSLGDVGSIVFELDGVACVGGAVGCAEVA